MRYRGLLVVAFAAISVAAFVPAGVHASAWIQDAQAQETEESRTKKALELFNQGQYVKAAKEYEKLITDFPDSRNMEDLEYYLVYSEWYAQKLRSARERAEKFLAARPKGKHAAHYQLSIASILQNQGKKQEAIAAYKKLFKDFPNTNESQSALWQYWNLVEKQFQFRVNQSWSEGEQPVVHGYLRNVDSVKFKLFKLDTSAVVKAVEAGKPVQSVQELVATTPASARTTVKEWTEEPNVGRQEWKSIEFKPEIKEAGIYMFEAMHDDIAMHVSIVVARYGLIVKSADNRLVSFAVDRRTGQPIEGMTVHVFDPNKKNEKGVTDAQGLAVFENAHQGAVVGIKDGELALSNAYHYGSGEEQKMVFFTDRPVYRPNNVVHWKGVFRAAKDGEFRNFSKTAVRVEIRDPRWNLVYQKDHTTDAMGTVDGDFTLGDEPSLGHYYIQSSIGGQGTFGVEEYRKPEYEVSVNFDGRPYTTGDSLKGAIAVMYYFGSPVVDADVQYTIYRRPYYKPYWRYWACDWWYDDDEDDDDGEVRHHKGGKHGYYYGWGESIYTGAGKTDKEGRMTFDFAPPKVEYDAVYTVIARVVDKSRREVTGQADAKMTRSKIELNISAGRYVYAPGDKVSIKVRVTDIDGKAVKNQPLKFRASTAEWHWRKAREIGEYEYGDFFSGEAKTDEQGMADFTFTAEDKKQGYIRFFATTEDDRGNEVTDDHWVWISDYSWSGTFDNLVGLDLVPDQDGYKLGDTAKVLMTSARKNVHVLVTTECEGIYSYKVVHMKGHTQMVEVPLTEKRMAPNVYVTATTLVKNEYLQKTKSLAVAPSHGLLNVKVTSDKKSYRPRETMEVTVEVTDDKGRPVQDAQLSLGIVDESIYAVQNEHMRDLRKFFWARRWNRVYTMTSMHFYDWGRGEFAGAAKEADAKAPGAPAPKAEAERSRGDEGLSKGKKNQAGAMAATETRSYFPDTMHWNPAAMTGADGKFSFKTTMPDSLTEWRTTVRAITADTKVGNTTHAVIARKEVIVRLTTPRFLTQNDTCTISGVVHNYRNDVDDVRVTLQAEGVEIVGDRDVTIKVPTGEDKRVDWKVIVKKAGTASFTAKAETPVESDAMRLDLPILPHGAMQYVAKAGTVEDKTAVKVSVPKTAIEEASELRITVSPSVASQVVDALEYLAGYPYGCVEQTMSRFLPTVTVARTLQKLNLPNKKLQEELPDMVNAGLQRLYNFQHSDGGWGWWEADQSNPYLTAYVVYGLAKAKEADFPVEQNVMERGIQALANLIELSKKRDVKE